MRVLIVSQKVGDLYGQEKIVSASTQLLRAAGHAVEWVAESCSGQIAADAFHQIPEIFHLNSFTPKAKVNAALAKLWQVVGKKSDGIPTVVHFVDHVDPRVFIGSAERFPTVFTAHTAAPTCPASGRVVSGLPVCPQKSGWSCLKFHYRYHCLDAQRTALHRAHAVYEFKKKHAGLKAVHRLFAVSHFLQAELMREGYRKAKISFVPNPISIPTGLPKVTVPKNLLVGAARLVPLKGFHHAIEALKSIEDEAWQFWILGDGPERERLGAMVERFELSSRIRFLGRKSAAETAAIIEAAIAVVQPNLGPEGFGMTVAEASAMGKPVVAYDVPGLNEVIEHEKTGLLAKFGDVSSLALSLSRLVENETLRNSLGEEGRLRMAALYSPERHRDETLKNYELAIQG